MLTYFNIRCLNVKMKRYGSLGFAVVVPIYWGSLLQKAQFSPPHVEKTTEIPRGPKMPPSEWRHLLLVASGRFIQDFYGSEATTRLA
jgi:hypothetical protein